MMEHTNSSNLTPTESHLMASMEQLEQHYYEITELYNLAEELVDTVESEMVKDQQAQLALVEPIVDELSEATDILSEEFLTIANKKTKSKSNGKIEGALRRIYMAIDAYYEAVTENVHATAGGFRNIADPIINKIKRQMETIVAALVDFIELSLNRIMSASHAEELKQRQEKIAMMLHQMGQGT